MESITSFERRQGAELIVAEANAERNDKRPEELKQKKAAGDHGHIVTQLD